MINKSATFECQTRNQTNVRKENKTQIKENN